MLLNTNRLSCFAGTRESMKLVMCRVRRAERLSGAEGIDGG